MLRASSNDAQLADTQSLSSIMKRGSMLVAKLSSRAAEAAHRLFGTLLPPSSMTRAGKVGHATDAQAGKPDHTGAGTASKGSSSRSTGRNEKPPTKDFDDGDDKRVQRHWALLVAGSSGWSNYRHQADVCHAYQASDKGTSQDGYMQAFRRGHNIRVLPGS